MGPVRMDPYGQFIIINTYWSLELHSFLHWKEERTANNTEHIIKNVQRRIVTQKTTAPRIPAWSPTVVLTGRHSG